MYCYLCAKRGKIRRVLDGLEICDIGHNVHRNLTESVELPKIIENIKDKKSLDEIYEISEKFKTINKIEKNLINIK